MPFMLVVIANEYQMVSQSRNHYILLNLHTHKGHVCGVLREHCLCGTFVVSWLKEGRCCGSICCGSITWTLFSGMSVLGRGLCGVYIVVTGSPKRCVYYHDT